VGKFGDKLRRQRELRGLSLDAISTTTKISTRMLRALEDEHFDQLPGGVFNKGFVRAYARQVGLNEEEAVNDYLFALAESQIQAQTILPNFRSAPAREETERRDRDEDTHDQAPGRNHRQTAAQERRTRGDRRSELRRGEDRESQSGNHQAFAEKQIVEAEDQSRGHVNAIFVQNHFEDDLSQEPPSQPPSFLNLSAPEPSTQNFDERSQQEVKPNAAHTSNVRWARLAIPLIVVLLAVTFWTMRRRGHAAATELPAAPMPQASAATDGTLTPTVKSSVAPVRSTPAPAPAPAKPSKSAPESDVTKDVMKDVTKSVVSTRPKVSKPKAIPSFTLTVRAAETSWVAISADGQPVAHETLIAPANTSVRATKEIVVRTGNAAGVSFRMNGIDFPAQGGEGEVRAYTFNSSGLVSSTAATPASASH
jgi:hypothetical protein